MVLHIPKQGCFTLFHIFLKEKWLLANCCGKTAKSAKGDVHTGKVLLESHTGGFVKYFQLSHVPMINTESECELFDCLYGLAFCSPLEQENNHQLEV